MPSRFAGRDKPREGTWSGDRFAVHDARAQSGRDVSIGGVRGSGPARTDVRPDRLPSRMEPSASRGVLFDSGLPRSRGDIVTGDPPAPVGSGVLEAEDYVPRPICGEVHHSRWISLGATSAARVKTLVTSPTRASLPCLPADWTETNCRGYRRVMQNPVKSRAPRHGKCASGPWWYLGTGCLHPVDN